MIMKNYPPVNFCLALILVVCCQSFCFVADMTSCNIIQKKISHKGQLQYFQEPVVWGKPYQVPQFLLRFILRKTSEPLKNTRIIVRYTFKWLEYPYPEHLLGAWSKSYDLLDCKTDELGIVTIPAYEVCPRGWYKGVYMTKRPEFIEIEINECKTMHTVFWTRKEIDSFKKNNQKMVLTRFDGFESEVKIEVVPYCESHSSK